MDNRLDFDLTRVLNEKGTVGAKFSLENVQGIMDVFESPAKGTEEFLTAAIENFGTATRMGMFAAMSIENYIGCVRETAKLMEIISGYKANGMESYQATSLPDDPFAYAIEGKASEFWKNVWNAILTAVRRVMLAIANLMKWIRNALMSSRTKVMAKHYLVYKTNAGAINNYLSHSKESISTLPWRFNSAGDIAKLMTKICGVVIKSNNNSWSAGCDKVFNAMSVVDLKSIKSEAEFNKFIDTNFKQLLATNGLAQIFNVKNKGAAELKAIMEGLNKVINKSLAENQAAIGGPKMFGSSKMLVNSVFTTAPAGKTPASKAENFKTIIKKSSNFEVLKVEWFTKNVQEVIASATKAEQDLTKLTSVLAKLSKKFTQVTETEKNSKVNSLSLISSKLANSRIHYNSYFSGCLLDAEAMVIRFRITADQVLTKGIAGINKAKTDANKGKKKGSESLNYANDFFGLNGLN